MLLSTALVSLFSRLLQSGYVDDDPEELDNGSRSEYVANPLGLDDDDVVSDIIVNCAS